MRIAIWARSPSPHQADFYATLRGAGFDLQVRYLESLRQSRRALGWSEAESSIVGEQILTKGDNLFASLPDWRQRIHVIPGYSRRAYWQVAVALSQANVPWVHWSERSRPSWRSPLSWPIKQWYARLVNRHALGAFAQGILAVRAFERWGIQSGKIRHLYYAIDGLNGSGPLDATTKEFVDGRLAFIYVGSISRAKASDTLVRAFLQVASAFRDVALVMVGTGPFVKRCKKMASQANANRQILFRGVVPMHQMRSVLGCGHVLVQPSLYDGWGVVLNEGASAGLALIASDRVGAAYHLIDPGRNGFRVRGGSTASLAAAMCNYAACPALAKEHGAHSLEVFQNFTPQASVARFATAISSWLVNAPQWKEFRDEWQSTVETLDHASTAA